MNCYFLLWDDCKEQEITSSRDKMTAEVRKQWEQIATYGYYSVHTFSYIIEMLLAHSDVSAYKKSRIHQKYGISMMCHL